MPFCVLHGKEGLSRVSRAWDFLKVGDNISSPPMAKEGWASPSLTPQCYPPCQHTENSPALRVVCFRNDNHVLLCLEPGPQTGRLTLSSCSLPSSSGGDLRPKQTATPVLPCSIIQGSEDSTIKGVGSRAASHRTFSRSCANV